MSGNVQPPGWYPAQGDEPGTVRWWDGTQWVGGPQSQGAQQQDGYVVPGRPVLANGRELADPWMRVAAAIIDGVLVFIVTAVLGGAAAYRAINGDGVDGFNFTTTTTVGALGVLSVVIVTAYHTLMNTFMSGGVGKQLLGLRIVRADGTEPLGTPDGLKRSGNHLLDLLGLVPVLGLIVAFFVQGVLNLVSLVFLFSDPEHRTVMDRFADTYVVTKQ